MARQKIVGFRPLSNAGLLSFVMLIAGILAADINAAGRPALVQAVRNRDAAQTYALIRQKVDVNAADPDGATALHWAAYGNDVEILRVLLRSGARANVTNVYGITPLALASLNANATSVHALLEFGADPNIASSSGETPLMTAARTGDVNVVKALVAGGAAVNASEMTKGQTALMWAAAHSHSAVVRALIRGGARVDARTHGKFTPLLFAARSGDVESARELLAAGAQVTDAAGDRRNALIIAAGSGHSAMVAFLLERGADPNVTDGGATALHAAVWGNPNSVELIELLIAHGANPNVRATRPPPQRMVAKFNGDIYDAKRMAMGLNGATPFALAAAQADVNAMRALAVAGADAKTPLDNGSTPLMLASGLGWTFEQSPDVTAERALAAVQLAVDLGSDLDAKNSAGRTALHGAANQGVVPVIKHLVARGADVNALDAEGRTPLWQAGHAQLFNSIVEQPEAMRALRELGGLETVSPDAANTR